MTDAGRRFLGDAAHTMSPMAGQGLNVAIRDSIVAANHMIDAVKAGRPIDDAVFRAIEKERRPEIDAIQAIQARVHRMVDPGRPRGPRPQGGSTVKRSPGATRMKVVRRPQ